MPSRTGLTTVITSMILALGLFLFQNCSPLASSGSDENSSILENVQPKIILSEPNTHIAFPQIVKAPDGTLLTFATVGSNHYGSCNDTYVVRMQSLDGGLNWSAPETVLSEVGASLGLTSVTVDGGHLVATLVKKVFAVTCNRTSASTKTYSIIDSVDGRVWSLRNQMRTLAYGTPWHDQNGDLWFSSYWGGEYTALGLRSAAGNLINGSGAVNGRTGAARSIFPFESNVAPFSYSETAYVRLRDGRIYGVARAIKDFFTPRPRDYFLFESVSTDDGATWSAPTGIGRGGPAELLVLRDGSVLRCYTYRRVYHVFGGPHPLILDDATPPENGGIYCQLSTDHTATWSAPKLVAKNNEHWDMGYIETVEHPTVDGAIVMVYYDNDGVGDSLASVTDSESAGQRAYRIWRTVVTKHDLL